MVENSEDFAGKPSDAKSRDNLESDIEKQEEELKRLTEQLEESKS